MTTRTATYEPLTHWQTRGDEIFAGEYASEGEPDAHLSVEHAENPEALARQIVDILNALEGIEHPAAWIRAVRATASGIKP